MIWEAGAIVFVRSLADLEMKKERGEGSFSVL
jgi:hypothetical protein